MKAYSKKGYKNEGYTKGVGQTGYDKKPSDIPGKGTDTGRTGGSGYQGGKKTGYYKDEE